MQDHSAEFRRCLVDCDVDGIMKVWNHVSPHLPQPPSREAALISLHIARTGAESVSLKLRAYSHRWLLDNGYPSSLPDRLKPSAERIYPKVVSGVGISCNAKSDLFKPIVGLVQSAMEYAVEDAAAEGKIDDSAFVKARMQEARATTIKHLLGRIA